MNIQQYTKYLFPAVLILPAAVISVFSSQAFANECGALSPLRKALGDDYGQLSYSAAADAQSSRFSDDALADIINSHTLRSGTGVRHTCFGPHKGAHLEKTVFRMDDIKRSNTISGNVKIKVWEESRTHTKSALIELPKAHLWKQTANGAYTTTQMFRRLGAKSNGPSTLIELDEDGQLINTMETQPVFPAAVGFTHLGEITLELQRIPGGFTITETTYIAGQISDWVTWKFKG